MKYLLIFTLAPFMLLAQGPNVNSLDENLTAANTVFITEEGDGWLKDYDAALADAKKEKRNVLIYFTGSDWCPPCKMLQRDLFDTEAFKSIAVNYTLLYIDIPRNRELISPEQMKHNSALVSKINKKGVFPLLVVMNEKGSQIDQYSGYSMTGEVRYHLELLEKHKN